MINQNNFGIFIHHDNSHSFGSVVSYARNLPGVAAVWQSGDLPLDDVDLMLDIINGHKINRIIIAGDLPGMVKSFFSEAMAKAGHPDQSVELASFKEFGADEVKAKMMLYTAVKGIPYPEAAITKKFPVNPVTLVMGGGIAGIQTSLEVANAGYMVHLVERTGTIGGHMAMFDKTFPTLDCAACILTPKMVEVGQHENINLLTYSEVQSISGEPGNYHVKILKKARHVNLSTCIGCGTCSEKCPSKVYSEFDANTNLRKAIYIPFPQAVPNKYLVDAENCTYIQSDGKKCGNCLKFCPVENCINLWAKDEEIEITVGNIVVATGFKTFDPIKTEQFGYGKFPNVLTSLELERLINAAGPTGGNITKRIKDKKQNWVFTPESGSPQSVAFIHCVGSRDENHNKYCSKVCCMYSLKLAHLVKEKLPDAEVAEFYIDMRAFGKGYEEFYNRIKNEGILMIRGRTATIEQHGEKLLLRSEDIENDCLLEKEFDMVVLAVGLEPRYDAEDVSKMLKIKADETGWFKEANYNIDPSGTFSAGITIAGVCQGPKDIPDTVAQASAAAARVLQSILNGEVNGNDSELTLRDIEKNLFELSQ